MTWKIDALIERAKQAEIEIMVQAGNFDAEFQRLLHNRYRHKRYRANKRKQQLARVHAVADELRQALPRAA